MSRSRGARRIAPLLSGLLVLGLLVLGAPAASAIDTPSGLSVSEGSARILTWSRVPGAASYDVQLAGTASFSPTLQTATTVNDEYVPTIQLPVGEVWWRVRARAGSTVGDWTTSTFSTLMSAAPVPVRPLQDATFQAPTTPLFTWEPVPGATSYTVQTSSDPAFVDPTLIASNKQDTTAAYLVEYPVVGDYYWRVQAELTSGYATAWSEPLRYHVKGLPPATLQGPADSFGPEVTDVVLDWAPVTGAATYELQVSPDENFLTTVESKSDVMGTRYSPLTTLHNDEYYWRVRPVDTSGNAAPWPAEPWKFRRAWSAQPVATYPQGVVDNSRPFFYQWEPIERANRYTVILFDELGAVVCTKTTVHTTLAGGCVPSTAGSYRWRVVGIDDARGVVTDQISQPPTAFEYAPPPAIDPAPAGTLSVADVAGHRVSLTGTGAFSAAPGDTCVGAVPSTCLDLRQTPVLTWNPVPGATSYVVTLSRDRELTTRIEDYEVQQPMWTPPISTTLADGQAGAAYYWVVQPCTGDWCAPAEHATHSFAKKSVAPRPASPADGAEVANDVTLAWGSELAALRAPGAAVGSALTTPGTMEARSYTVQTALDPGFSAVLRTTFGIDETTFTAPEHTYPEGIVYWRVRAVDGGGNGSVWSEPRSFVKRSPVPELLTPVDGAALGQDYAVAWKPLDFAASYDVEVYAGPTKVAAANTPHASWAPSDPYPASVDDYTWRVRRVDADGRKGDWSPLRAFRFAGFPVSQVAPAASEVVPPSGARFTWVSDARATSYRFERRKPGSTDLAESVVTRATAWSPTSALASGTGQWRVVALDTGSKSLGSSPWRDFVVIDPPAVVTPVTIAGSGAVGTELRVFAPTFDPAAETTTYQWYRGTSQISGATGETYTVVAADLGKAITVRATGTVAGYQSATSTSNAIGGEAAPPLLIPEPVTISGTGALGTDLSAEAPVFDPAALSTSYQWYRGTSKISGATGQTYTVVAADLGKALTVQATGVAPPGHQDTVSTSNAITAVSTPPMKVVVPVAVTGGGAVGTELRATAPSFDPAAASVAYQWYRGTSAITGATGPSYSVGPSDVGKEITVRATGSAPGYANATSTSTPVTGVTGGAPAAERAPDVSGTAAVGSRLTVVPGAWAGSPKLTYQWYRDGVPISRATSTSYSPTATDAARTLTVVETATLTGRAAGTATSRPVTVAKIASTAKVMLSPTSTTVRKRVTATVTVTAPGIAAPGGSVSVYVGKKRVKVLKLGAGTSVSIKLPKQKPGIKTVRAVYSGGIQVLGSSAKAKLKVTRR